MNDIISDIKGFRIDKAEKFLIDIIQNTTKYYSKTQYYIYHKIGNTIILCEYLKYNTLYIDYTIWKLLEDDFGYIYNTTGIQKLIRKVVYNELDLDYKNIYWFKNKEE